MAEIEKISYCPHCGNNAPQKLVHTQLYSERAWSAEDGAEDKLPAAYFVAVCQTCHQLLLYGSTGISSEEAAFRQAGLVWPQSGRLHSAVPRTVAAIYTEAARIKSIAPNAFASQIRRALEAICEDRGARKQNLQASLKELADKGEIPPILAEAVDVLRLLGNVGPCVSVLMRYWLSEYSVITAGSRTARSPTTSAMSSMRLLVVTASPPLTSSISSSPQKITAA
jgi:hypothetical protein